MANINCLPIDAETISSTVDPGELIGHLNLLLGQCRGEDESRGALRLFRMVERHVAMSNRPTKRTHAHDAYSYMRDSAVFVSTLLSVYQKANGAEE